MAEGQLVGGCDVGSTTGKAVILRGREVVGSALCPSRIDPELTAREALAAACAQVPGLAGPEALACLCGTGYGRLQVPFADHNISEITCHGAGAHLCDPDVRTIIDIGGQDIKAIGLHADGTVREFAMNDKCAAGTGRFLEAMCRAFQMDFETFSGLSIGAGSRVVPVTAQCSVFAETEVVSLIAQKKPPGGIAAGIHVAVAKRVFALARRVGVEPKLTVTGGCAKSQGLAQRLAAILRHEVVQLSFDPQLMGALGAAEIARRKCSSGMVR